MTTYDYIKNALVKNNIRYIRSLIFCYLCMFSYKAAIFKENVFFFNQVLDSSFLLFCVYFQNCIEIVLLRNN